MTDGEIDGEIYELHTAMHLFYDLNDFIKIKKQNNTTYTILYKRENEYNQESNDQENNEQDNIYHSILQEAIQFKQLLSSYLTDLKSGKVYPHSHHGFSTSNIIFKEEFPSTMRHLLGIPRSSEKRRFASGIPSRTP